MANTGITINDGNLTLNGVNLASGGSADNTGLLVKDGKLYLNGEAINAGGGDIDLQAARLLLPRYMDVVVDRQCDFFLDDYLDNPDNLDVRYSFPDNVGATLYDRGHIRIESGTVGYIDLTISTYCGETLIGTPQTITIRKVARSGFSGAKNILIVGDSLVDYPSSMSPNPAQTYALLADDADVTINQIGTHNPHNSDPSYVDVNHEGYGGKTWAWFCGSESPFYYNGGIDFKAYMSDHFPSLSGIDYCIVMLGTNDTLNTIETYSKRFIDKLIADFPNCKVAVGIPPLGASFNGVAKSSYYDKLIDECGLYLGLYDNGKYHPNVTCVGQGCWIDRENHYPHTDTTGTITPYDSNALVTSRVFSDVVHPGIFTALPGYKQWGRAVYCKIRSWIAGNL